MLSPELSIERYSGFSGSASELAAAAIDCGTFLDLGDDLDKTNERLVRFYVTEGIIDRPVRVGRDAAYGYRHLVQFLTARRLAKDRFGLSDIKEHTQSTGTTELVKALNEPVPTAAQLLVNRFQGAVSPASKPLGSRQSSPSAIPRSPSLSKGGPVASPVAPDAVSALAHEVERMRIEVAREMRELFMERKKAEALQQDLASRLDRLLNEHGRERTESKLIPREIERIRDELDRFRHEFIGRFSLLMSGQDHLREVVGELGEAVRTLVAERDEKKESGSELNAVATPDVAPTPNAEAETDKPQGEAE